MEMVKCQETSGRLERAPGLEEDRDDDQAEAVPEGRPNLSCLAEEDGGEDDALIRLQIVNDIYSEGGKVPQGVDLQ